MKLRGLITSLGAGGSLIAAALSALVLVGEILAVGGAGGGAGAEPADVLMPGATETAAAAAPDGFAGSDAVVARDPVATADRPRPAAPRSAVRRVAPRPPAPAPGGSAPLAALAPEAPSGDPPAAPSEPAPPSPEGTTAEVANVRPVVQQARATAAPEVEAAPVPVPPVTSDVVAIAEQVAGTVDETLAPGTGPLP